MTIPEAGTPQSQREQTLRLHIGTAQARDPLAYVREHIEVHEPTGWN